VDSISEEQTARKELEQRLSTETARAESFRAKVAELTATTNATNEIEKIIKDKLTGMVTLMLSQTPTTLQTKIDEITSTPVQNLKALMEQTESQFDTWKSAKNGEQSMGENMPLAAIKDFHSKR
jgi:outer membrane murein-binding lipoprotein Lpp